MTEIGKEGRNREEAGEVNSHERREETREAGERRSLRPAYLANDAGSFIFCHPPQPEEVSSKTISSGIP